MHVYEKIRTEMLHRITRQIWPSGSLVPHEEKLAEEFGVARGTVRRAMADLVQQGLIERRRRAGTRVAARSAHSSILTIPVVRKEISARGEKYGYKLLSVETGDAAMDMTGYFHNANLVHVQCLHLADGRPYQYEDRLINLDAVPDAADHDFTEMSPNEWLIERVPYSAVRTALKAEAANETQARYLKVKRNSPVFVIERQTQLDHQPITFVTMSHPSANFSIVTQTENFD